MLIFNKKILIFHKIPNEVKKKDLKTLQKFVMNISIAKLKQWHLKENYCYGAKILIKNKIVKQMLNRMY